MHRHALAATFLLAFAATAVAGDDGCCRPRSKGSWHRQCLGAGELSPPGGGRGPGLHPAYTEEQLREIFRRADRRIAGRCEGACDALDPKRNSTPEGRALAQYAAFVLNREAGRLDGCDRSELDRELSFIEQLLERGRHGEARERAEAINVGHSVRRCEGDRDDDREGQPRHGRDEFGPDDDDQDDQGHGQGKDKEKDKDKDKGKGAGQGKGKGK